jgi:hypothetical protein
MTMIIIVSGLLRSEPAPPVACIKNVAIIYE